MKLSVRLGLGLAALLAAGLVADAATEHDNVVDFHITGIMDFSFKTTGHDITPGQPYGGETTKIKTEYRVAQMNVRAGRKGSSSAADWFRKQVGSGATVNGRTSDAFPKSLNFALAGTISMKVDGLTTTCDNIVLGQGNHAGYNDWWIGGPGVKKTSLYKTVIQTCKTDSKPASVLIQPDCVPSSYCYGFTLSPHPI